jgi:hypothetical protein
MEEAAMTLDEATDAAFAHRATTAPMPAELASEVRELIQAEVDRLTELTTWEARFAKSILEPLADELYVPQLRNAAIA